MSQLIETSAFSSTIAQALPENAHRGLRQYPQPPTQGNAHGLTRLGQVTRNIGQLTQANDGVSAFGPRSSMGSASSASNSMMRETQEHDVTSLPRVQLDGKGHPLFGAFQARHRALGTLLHSTLAQGGQTYQAVHTEQQDQFLLDAQGHVLQLRQSPEAVVTVRSSLAQGSPAGGSSAQQLESQSSVVRVRGGQVEESLQTLPRAYLAHLTGTHRDSAGQRLCLHEQQLYRFDDSQGAWALAADAQDLTFSALLTQGNGKVYGQTERALIDLSSPGLSRVALPADVKACSVSADRHVAVLSGDQASCVQLINLRQPSGAPRTVLLSLDNGLAQPQSIALGAHHLFITDTQGRLYSVRRDELDGGELNLLPRVYDYPSASAVKEHLGGHRQVVGLLSGDHGQVHALVSDRGGLVHAHLVEGDQQRLSRGWNLGDVMVLNNRNGLPTPQAPTSEQTWDLGRLGRIGLSEQRLVRWDAASQAWADTGIKAAEQLQRGCDGKAYLLQDGVLKKLDVSHKPNPLAFGGNHALSQRPQTIAVAVKEPLAALEGRTVAAFAVLNDKQFVVLDTQRNLTVHHAQGEPTLLNFPVGVGQTTALAFDAQQRLYAMTDWGELFVMNRELWQASDERSRAAAVWTAVATPPGMELASIRTADNQRLSATFSDHGVPRPMQLDEQQWQPLQAQRGDHNPFYDLSQRLRGAEVVSHIPHTGLTVRASGSFWGRSALENDLSVSAGEFFRANIFKPTLETPRVLKNMGHYVQHQYQGRKGLSPLYAGESAIFKRFDAISQQPPATTPSKDLRTRIGELPLGPQGAALRQALHAFEGQLQGSSLRTLKHLGQQQGQSKLLRQKIGVLDARGEAAAPSRRRTLSLGVSQLAQKLNINSAGHDLVHALKAPFSHLAPDSAVRKMLDTLDANGLRISHQKVDVPLGQRRDGRDSQGLNKARLALDAVALADLARALERFEASGNLEQLQADFEQAQSAYDTDLIRQITDMGFADHASLEAAYDGIKAFLNGLKKADHAISVNLRAAMGSQNQDELAQAFKTTLRHLNPDDELSLQRGYGLNLSTPSLPVPAVAPSAGLGGARNYGLSAERVDKGLKITLLRDGVTSANLGVGYSAFKNEIKLPNDGSLGANLGASLSASSTTTQRNAVEFIVPDEGIEQFVDDLFGGRLDPLSLIRKTSELAAQKSHRLNLEVNASVTAEIRGGHSFKADDSPGGASYQLGVGFTAGANLLTYARHSVEQRNIQEQVQETSKNRPRLLNSLTGSLSAKGQVGGSHQAPNDEALSTSLGVAFNAAGTVESKTSKRIKYNFKQAVPLTAQSLQKLGGVLRSAFRDGSSQQTLARLADQLARPAPGVPAQEALVAYLNGLSGYFLTPQMTPRDNEQYAARQALQRAVHEQTAAQNNLTLLDNARFESAYTNLARLDQQGAVSAIMGLVHDNHTPSNAQEVARLLKEDLTLKALVKQLQASPGTLVKVRLEPKDSIQELIHTRSLQSDLSADELAALLCDRRNMRIKAITVSQSASKTEGFAAPVPVISYSSTAALNVVKALGKISFSYGLEEDKPRRYVLEGALANPSEAFKGMLSELKKEGFELNR